MVNITKEVFSEVYDIIQHMEEELYNRIPKGFIKFINNNRDENFRVNIDYSKTINDQDLQRGTKVLLSLIYRDYLCEEEEKKRIIEKDKTELKRVEEELREKYNTDNLFKKQTKELENNEKKEIVIYKQTLIKRILNKLKQIF